MINASSNSNRRLKRPFKVLVSIVTLWSFLFSLVSYDLTWAARTPLEPTGVGSNRAGSLSVVKDLNVDTFAIPEYLGQVRDSFKASSDKVVIHIQDAHCNYAAQKRIAEIIEYLNKEHGINTVNLEGGVKDYDLSTFTRISDKDIRDKVADYFVKEGLVNGAEYFAINNPDKATLWGIEDTKLYIDNLNIYRDSLKYKNETDKQINALTHILNNLKAKIYSQDLLDLDTKYSQYKAGSLEFKDYLAYLIQTAKHKLIDIKPFTSIYLLSQTLAEEGNVDFRKANNERDDLIDRLQKKLSKKSLEELVLKTVEFKKERISQKDFYIYLTKKADFVGVELKDFPELQKYIVYISMYNAIDKTKIMEEIETLENKIKEMLYQNDKQEELNKLSKNLAILKNIFSISLTKEDYKYYIDNEQSFDMRNYVSFINKEAPLYKITAQLDKNISGLDHNRENIAKFYEYSFKRDNVFLNNIKFNKNIAVVITGGFHTENLCETFKERNISYISIMPAFSNYEGYQCPYFRLLSGKQSDIVNSLSKDISSLALYSDFCQNSDQIYGKNLIEANRLWIALVAALFSGKESIVVGKRLYTFKQDENSMLVKGVTIGEKQLFARLATGAELADTTLLPIALEKPEPWVETFPLEKPDPWIESFPLEKPEPWTETFPLEKPDPWVETFPLEKPDPWIETYPGRLPPELEKLLQFDFIISSSNSVENKQDVNLAAGRVQKASHNSVNNFIKDNIPQELKDNPANVRNYRRAEGYGVGARVIPIKGLFKATGQFAHIGLGQVYGEPVIYVDADYQDNDTVLNHELYEISKWEAKRNELGRAPGQMRQWIIDNFEEANKLAEQWHSEAPSLGKLFAENPREEIETIYPEEHDINLAAGPNVSLEDKLYRLFARPRDQRANFAWRVAPLQVKGQESVDYTGNRGNYLEALRKIRVKDNILNEGLAELGFERHGEAVIRNVLVRDTDGNKFIAILKNGRVDEIAMPVIKVELPGIKLEEKYEFIVVDDNDVRKIMAGKIEDRLMSGEPEKQFAPGGEAKIMGGLLNENEIDDAKDVIRKDPLLAHLFGVLYDKFPGVNFRGFIVIEVPEDYGGYYDGQRIAKVFGRKFQRELYAHEITHHIYAQLQKAANRIKIGKPQPGDEELIGLFQKIQNHLQEDTHSKLFEWLRNDKLYAARVNADPVYLRNEALAYIVGAIFDRKVVEPRSGYKITFGDIQLLVELGILPSEIFGNPDLFEGVDLNAPLPEIFFQVAELCAKVGSISKALADENLLKILKENISEKGIGSLLNLAQWMIKNGHFKEAEELLIRIGQDQEVDYSGKQEELLFGFFILYQSWPSTDSRNVENIFNLLLIQLQVDSSAKAFLNIFANKGLDKEQLKAFFAKQGNTKELKEKFSKLLIILFSELDKATKFNLKDKYSYARQYSLYQAIGMIYFILGMEDVAEEFFTKASEIEKLLEFISKSKLMESLVSAQGDNLSPEERERKLGEAMEGQGFDISSLKFLQGAAFDIAKYDPLKTLDIVGDKYGNNIDAKETAGLLTANLVKGIECVENRRITIQSDLLGINPDNFVYNAVDNKIVSYNQPTIEIIKVELVINNPNARGRVAAVFAFLRMIKYITKILIDPKVDMAMKKMLLRLVWASFKSNLTKGFFDDINIADVGLDAPEHREVNRVIKQAALEGRLEDKGMINGRRIIVVKGVDVLAGKQRAHAGIEANVIYIAEGVFSPTLAQHEAIELQKWQEKALELSGMDKNTDWNVLSQEQRKELKENLRKWMRENIEEARKLEAQYHGEANQQANIGGTIVDNFTLYTQPIAVEIQATAVKAPVAPVVSMTAERKNAIGKILPARKFKKAYAKVGGPKGIIECKIIKIANREVRVVLANQIHPGNTFGISVQDEDAVIVDISACKELAQEIVEMINNPDDFIRGTKTTALSTISPGLNKYIIELLSLEFGSPKRESEILDAIIRSYEEHELEHKRRELLGLPSFSEDKSCFAQAEVTPYYALVRIITVMNSHYFIPDRIVSEGYAIFQEINEIIGSTAPIFSKGSLRIEDRMKELTKWFEEKRPLELLSRADISLIAHNLRYGLGKTKIAPIVTKNEQKEPTGLLTRETLETRQATTTEAFNTDYVGKDNDVKVVVGVPIDMNRANVQPTLSVINRGLAKNGFGKMEDNKQVITFEIDAIDAVKTAQNQERAMQRAGEGLSPNGRVVLFAPQMERGLQLAEKAQKQYKGQGNVTVVPDAYTDSNPQLNIFPDVMVRVALGRNIAFYYTGKDPQGTLATIKDLLAKVADNNLAGVGDLNELLKKLNEMALRIRPIDYKTITDWQKSQEAVAVAL